MKTKPIVLYSFVFEPIILGQSAIVQPINHPGELVSNTTLAKTSPVVKIINDYSFETENTIYKEKHYAEEEHARTGRRSPVRYY